MATTRITESELLEALAASATGTESADARTVEELRAESGGSRVTANRIRDALKQLAAEGRLVVHRVTRRAIDGRMGIVPAYTVLPKAPKKKR